MSLIGSAIAWSPATHRTARLGAVIAAGRRPKSDSSKAWGYLRNLGLLLEKERVNVGPEPSHETRIRVFATKQKW